MINIVEALADSIMRFEGFYAPGSTVGGPEGSTSWRNRNPGNLRNGPYKIGIDNKGYAIYTSLSMGWSDLTRDIAYKLAGASEHKFTNSSTLFDFFETYAPHIDKNDPIHYARTIALFLSKIYNAQVTPEWTFKNLKTLGSNINEQKIKTSSSINSDLVSNRDIESTTDTTTTNSSKDTSDK